MATSRVYLFFVIIPLIHLMSAQEVVKRVPHGFVGMRGKKYSNSEEIEHFYKRKPQFFVGVKGKKSIFDSTENDNYYKRAPMGFVGMRGKKDYLSSNTPNYPESYNYVPNVGGSLFGQIDYSTNENLKNNAADSSILNDLFTSYLKKIALRNYLESEIDANPEPNEEQSADHITNSIEKRAGNIHQFFGVRGKKSLQNKRHYDLTFRGKFIGVRGKKDLKNSGAQEIKFLLDQSGPWPKRKAQMGFFGMRGKKWTDESSPEMEPSN